LVAAKSVRPEPRRVIGCQRSVADALDLKVRSKDFGQAVGAQVGGTAKEIRGPAGADDRM